jgi:hypothetical protein
MQLNWFYAFRTERSSEQGSQSHGFLPPLEGLL